MDSSTPSETPRPSRVLLCLSGSISAYKIADVVSLIRKHGVEVRCLLTPGAEHFVSPLVLETLSGNPVRHALFPPLTERTSSAEELGTEHIRLARWPDLIVFAPASANLIARLAHGLCDDLVTTVALATRAPQLLAPAMNTAMWEHPATKANLELLQTRGMRILPPAQGVLACGEEGAGKLPAPEALFEAIRAALEPPAARNSSKTLLITAGPTISRLDAVRYLTNPSTGKMGAALAEAALRAGCIVHYILGIDKGVVRPRIPGDSHSRFHLVEVETAEAMCEAALHRLPQVDGVIATAAVLDYRVEGAPSSKKKRSETPENWTLVPSVDVLKTLRENASGKQWFCGFAAETEDFRTAGRGKLERKRLDFLFANRVARTGERLSSGFGSERNSGVLLSARPGESDLEFPELSKDELGARLIEELLKRTEESSHASEKTARPPSLDC
jgi:phosphopantothenoylcysteine decarboxylase/phosphopantothenate--cysteine ligase